MEQYDARLHPDDESQANESFDLSSADTTFDVDAPWGEDVSFSVVGAKLGLVEDLDVSDTTQPAIRLTPEQELDVFCRLEYMSAEKLRKVSILEFWRVSDLLR